MILPFPETTGERTAVISSARHTASRASSCQRTERRSRGLATPVSTEAHSAPVQAWPFIRVVRRHWIRTHMPVSVR